MVKLGHLVGKRRLVQIGTQPRGDRSSRRNDIKRECNAFTAMSRLLKAPPPLAPDALACGTQLTRRWLRDGYNGYAPGMVGHLIATYHGQPQDCAWTLEGRRLAERLRPGTVTVVSEGHDGLLVSGWANRSLTCLSYKGALPPT